MNSAEMLHPGIAEALHRGATIVTANQRAARTLDRAFDLHNRQLGLTNWQPANVLAWDNWTTALWRKLLIDGHTSRLLLNRAQELTVWRQILASDGNLQSLKSKDALAELAADAWQRLCSYSGQGSLRGAAAGSDAQAFQRWAAEFQQRCRRNGYLAHAEIEAALGDAAKNSTLRLETSEVVFVGFDHLTTAQKNLVESLRSTGCTLTEQRLTVPSERRLLVSAANEEEEVAAAARWARQILEQHPESRIAVIVPSLDNQRAMIDRIFRDILAPELQNIAAPEDSCPYEFSLGTPLARTPMIAAALDLLRWTAGEIPIERATSLLLSPYFAMQPAERGARAEFDAFELRTARRLRPEISLDWISTLAYKSPRREKLDQLPSALRAMQITASRAGRSEQRTHTEWCDTMRSTLDSARWGAQRDTSVEFQIRRKWESALYELATLDFDGNRVTFSRALQSIEHIVAQTMFAPESHQAPVQIMGAFEAAGSTFDAVWLMRAGDLEWPVPASVNPLLSWRLQRELAMPGTDIASDDKDAQQVTQRIAASAATAIISYAVESEAGKQRPSPALKGIELQEVQASQIAPPAPQRAIIELELFEDPEPIQALPDNIAHGGTQILKDQAACPFRAFAEHRLWSTEIEQPEPGMDARLSGTVVHRVLELFWNKVKTQQALKKMPPQELVSILDDCIHQTISRTAPHSETRWEAAYIRLQCDRMRGLLLHWLDLERERSAFEVQLSEKNFDAVPAGPLLLNVRVDRIDRVEDGEVLIDYKTGNVTPQAWLGERPDEPQLPLYATLRDKAQLQGIAFGVVRAGEDCKLTGFAARKDILPQPRKMPVSSLDEQVDSWRRVLTGLAEGFHAGDARVSPKSYPKTCQHCTQRILCRLDPSQLQEEEDAEEVERD